MTVIHNTPGPYYAHMSPPVRAWRIVDEFGHEVDRVGTAAAAAYEVDMLNSGRAHVDSHAMLGCRVVWDRAVA